MFSSIFRSFKPSGGELFASSLQIQILMLRRLTLVGLLLAAMTGSLAYYFEIRNVDQEVGQMAVEKSSTIIKSNLPLIQNPTKENIEKLKTQLKFALNNSDFLLIEIYSPEKEELAEAAASGVGAIDRQAALHGKDLMKSTHTTNRGFVTGGHHYVQVFTALKTEGAKHVGFFEGLYRVPESTWNRIINRVYHTVGFIVMAVLGTTAILYPIILRLIRGLLRLSSDLTEANIGMLISMGAAIAKRDSDTDAHNYRVTILAVMLAESLNLPKERIRLLIVGSFMHDVGKVAISDMVLLKPGKLDKKEWAIMKTHVDHGVDVVKEHAWLAQATPVVHGHHEKFDGTGYPRGLAGEQIPLVARIFALVDVFDALSSKRPYKDPFPFEKCIAIIEEGRGSHFDPNLVDPFIKIVQEFIAIPGLNSTEALRPILGKYIVKYFQVPLN